MSYGRQLNKNYFLEQCERVIRWHERCIKKAAIDKKSSAVLMDYYLAFFIKIYQLDNSVSNWLDENKKYDLKNELEDRKNRSDIWLIIWDICTGAKHFNLHATSVGERFSTLRKYHHEKCILVLLIAGQRITFHGLSAGAVNFWEEYLHDTDLLKLQHEMDETPIYLSSHKVKRKKKITWWSS
jgi:hypothetical protein